MGNKDLAAARFAVRRAEGRLRASGLLPNPEIEFNGLSDFVGGGEGEGEFTAGLHQMFPLTSRLSLARQISRVEVAEALREVRDHERLLIARVQELYARVQGAAMREKAAGRALQDSRELVELARERLSSGQGSLPESALARVDEQRWANAAEGARADGGRLLVELKTALGMAADARLVLTEEMESVVDALGARLREKRPSHRPDVELALLALDRAGAEERLARASAWEGIRIGVEYMRDRSVDEPGGAGTGSFLGIKVNLPLPVWDGKKGGVAEAAAIREQRGAMVRALELQVANSIAGAERQVSLLQEQWRRYRRDTQPVLDSAGEEMSAGFSEGRVDARDLLMVRAQSASLRVEAAQILENLAITLIEVETAAGSHPSVNVPYLNPEPIQRKRKSKS